MATCQYFIKKTKNSRICTKNSSHTKSSFLAQNLRSELDFDIHLCSKHFGMISNQIRKKINHSAFFDFRYDHSLCSPQFGHNTNKWKFAQLISVLENCMERQERADDVIFIEEKNENQVLIRKFEEAKRDGRYIDLTEPKRKKQKNTRA